MSNPVFVRTAHHYDSYTDYWRLVELAGFDIIELADLDTTSDNTYIVTPVNGEWSQGWKNPKARIIAWILEWYTERPNIPGVSEYWTSDLWYAGQVNARYVPLGSYSELVSVRHKPDIAKWDICLLAYRDPARRKVIINQLERAGLKIAPNGWGKAREEILQRSKLMLHIHQHDAFPCIAAQRIALAASVGIPLISENMTNAYPMVAGEHYVSADYKDLAETARLLVNEKGLKRYGEDLQKLLCYEYNFGANVTRVLRAMEAVTP